MSNGAAPDQVPLEQLPIAAAFLDRHGGVLSANHHFTRIFGFDPRRARIDFAALVSDRDRAVVVQTRLELAALPDETSLTRRIRVTLRNAPSLALWTTWTRLGSGSRSSYLVCASAAARRRRQDASSDGPLPEARSLDRQRGPEPLALTSPEDIGAATRDGEPWRRLLMVLSHELRSPLAAIRGWAALAESGSLAAERRADAFRIIDRNAATLSRHIETLFDLSRQTAGRLSLDPKVLDLNDLVRLVVESTQPEASRHGVRLTARYSRPAPLVRGESLRLEQVLRNLVDNAIKFTPPGGEVRLETVCHGRHVEIVVDDSGIGIARDLLPVIFEPFRHGATALRRSDEGLGLGLALVRELVALHGGDVRARSGGQGRGSTFIVKLPLARSAEVA